MTIRLSPMCESERETHLFEQTIFEHYSVTIKRSNNKFCKPDCQLIDKVEQMIFVYMVHICRLT